MTSKIIENITTYLHGEEIGSISVKWDLQTYVFDDANKGDEDRQVIKIRSIEFQIFDKVGVDLSAFFIGNKRLIEILKERLLNAVNNYSIFGLEQEIKDNSIIG